MSKNCVDVSLSLDELDNPKVGIFRTIPSRTATRVRYRRRHT